MSDATFGDPAAKKTAPGRAYPLVGWIPVSLFIGAFVWFVGGGFYDAYTNIRHEAPTTCHVTTTRSVVTTTATERTEVLVVVNTACNLPAGVSEPITRDSYEVGEKQFEPYLEFARREGLRQDDAFICVAQWETPTQHFTLNGIFSQGGYATKIKTCRRNP